MNRKLIFFLMVLFFLMIVGCSKSKPKKIIMTKEITRQMLEAIGKQIDKTAPFAYVKEEGFDGVLTKNEIKQIKEYIGQSDKDVDIILKKIVESKSAYRAYQISVDLLGKCHFVLEKITNQLVFLDENYNNYMKACDFSADIINFIAKNHIKNYTQLVADYKYLKSAKATHDKLKKCGLSSSFLETAKYLENDVTDPQYFKKAESMFRLARTQYNYVKISSSVELLLDYASIFEKGKGGVVDLEKAEKLYKKAIVEYEKLGFCAYGDNYLVIGDIYANGKYVKKSRIKAEELWKKARKAYENDLFKYPEGYRKLAEMTAMKKAVPKYSIYNEMAYYCMAADTGDKKSILLLLAKGIGGYKYAIEPNSNKNGSFFNGLARFEQNGKFGYIDKKGKVVIPAKYKYVNDFYDFKAVVDFNDKEKGLIDNKGNIFFKCSYVVLAPRVSEGLLYFRQNESSQFGYINTKGEVVIPPQFNKVNEFSEKFASVKKDNYFGYIDKLGKFIIKPQFDEAHCFSEGLAIVKQMEKNGVIDKKGHFIVKPIYDVINNYHDGHALFLKKFKKPKNFDKNQFKNISSEKEKQLAIDKATLELRKVGALGNVGFLNKKGNVAKDTKYVYALNFSEGVAWYRERTHIKGHPFKYGCLTKDNYDNFTLHDYAEVKPFSEGLAAVKLDQKWGFVNTYGEWQIFPQFDYAESFHQGLAVVIIDNKSGYIMFPKKRKKQ